jgi:hypothetical protein
LAEKIVSGNAPSVTVVAPNGGERISRQTTIQWSGSDADGDNLAYTILFSADNGVTWDPIAANLTTTSYSWDTSGFPFGAQYRIRVIATDGFNTGEDVSDASFTNLGFVYLPVVLRK